MRYYITIFFLLAVLKIENVVAQSLDVFGGLNFSGMKHKLAGDTQDSRMSSGFQVGLGVVVPFNKSYYRDKNSDEMAGIYPSLQLIKKGLKKTTLVDPTPSDIKLSYLQFTAPIYTRIGSYGIGLGPYAAFATAGNTKYASVIGGDRKINFGNSVGNDLKRLDYGVSFTMSISIFYLQYDYGLANLGTGKYGTAKNRNFNFGLLIPLANRYE